MIFDVLVLILTCNGDELQNQKFVLQKRPTKMRHSPVSFDFILTSSRSFCQQVQTNAKLQIVITAIIPMTKDVTKNVFFSVKETKGDVV